MNTLCRSLMLKATISEALEPLEPLDSPLDTDGPLNTDEPLDTLHTDEPLDTLHVDHFSHKNMLLIYNVQ